MVAKIGRDELRVKIEGGEDFALVEALPPMYYEDAHLPGALNMPHDEVDKLAPALLPDKGREVIVYCANGPCKNSGISARRLIHLGYENVRDYHEGKQDWIEAGLPTESGALKAAS